MTDKMQMELITYETIKAQYPYWNRFKLIEELYRRGKQPVILHMDLIIDTSTATTLSETCDPTNQVINMAVPMQVYLRSDDAGDTSKKIDVIGQKADDSFGQFTLTSDDSDGTTPVDVGTWKFIMFVKKNDAWAGNVIIDDDGVSGTVYWTLALGVDSLLGIYCVPNGYCAAAIHAGAKALLAPTTPATDVVNVAIDHVVAASLSFNNPINRYHNPTINCDEGKVNVRSSYWTAAFSTKTHCLIALWQE